MFIALRPCRFAGRTYRIGDAIEDSVVDSKSVNRLKAAGKIAVVGGEVPSEPHHEEPYKPVEEPEENQGGNIPPASLEGPEGTQEELEEHIEDHYHPFNDFTQNQLERVEREKLVEYAASCGIDDTEEMSKKKIAEAIFAKRGE